MKTETRSISEFLSRNSTAFFIPPFQRSYAWGANEIKRYFEDIKRIIQSELSDDRDKLEHFFGTLVTKDVKMAVEKNGSIKYSNVSLIIDGQQRLTTTLIFLIALRDKVATISEKEQIQNDYLLNHNSDFENKIKLKQVTKDWDNYKALVNGEKAKPSIIKNAYDTFCHLIENYQADNKEKNTVISLENYIDAIGRLNIANIILDERPFKGEDPQIIFETLNSLGKPLTLSDLIRNYVLLNFPADKQTKVYETIWFPKIEQPLGDKSSEFFRDFLQYKISRQVKVVSNNNTKEIYAEFKSFVAEHYNNHDEFVNDIILYVPLYKLIITEENYNNEVIKNKEAIELLRNIFWDIKSEAFKPFVLGLLYYNQNENLSDEVLINCLNTILIYLIRRRILKIGQGENKAIPLFSKNISELANLNTNMFYLLTRQAYHLRFPNDDEIMKNLKEANFYEDNKLYAKFILGKIEEHNSKVSVDFRDYKITIEHIMPQSIDKSNVWKHMLGENFENIHKEYLHNIGNLILTEFNGEMGNKPFNEKQEMLKNSNLNFRIEILEKEKWSETEIRSHQQKMINDFLNTFYLPPEYRYVSNYVLQEEQKFDDFSPLDDEAGDIAKSHKPQSIVIYGQVIKTNNWQDVFITFLKFIRDCEKFDLEIVVENQREIFNRYDAIINGYELKQKIYYDKDFENRYKSFDGLLASKISVLNNSDLFIHINISAKQCIERIASIMNKFSMLDDSVKIKLKTKKQK